MEAQPTESWRERENENIESQGAQTSPLLISREPAGTA